MSIYHFVLEFLYTQGECAPNETLSLDKSLLALHTELNKSQGFLNYTGEVTMIKKILVPVDGSEQAHKAIEFAADLALHYDATIHLLHAFKLTIIPEGFGEYVVSDRIQLEAMGKKIIAAAEEGAKKAGVRHLETTVIEGDPAESIINYAKDHDVDIIVIGSRGLGSFKGLLLGSVSNKVSHRADRTCVIVR